MLFKTCVLTINLLLPFYSARASPNKFVYSCEREHRPLLMVVLIHYTIHIYLAYPFYLRSSNLVLATVWPFLYRCVIPFPFKILLVLEGDELIFLTFLDDGMIIIYSALLIQIKKSMKIHSLRIASRTIF